MKLKTSYFVLILILFISAIGYCDIPWPMESFDGPLTVGGTLGDARGNCDVPRFHRGIDIEQLGEVYSIESGTAIVVGNSVRVGNYYYDHVSVDPDLLNGNSQVIGLDQIAHSTPTVIGTIESAPGAHLHFQEGPTVGPFVNLLRPPGEGGLRGERAEQDTTPPTVWASDSNHE